MTRPNSPASHYHALIMAGGKGERFWPWSRVKRPKQLLPLFQGMTMIEMTVNRLLSIIPRKRIWIVTNHEQARAMSQQMPTFPKSNFIIEPTGRDSAGAVMLGCATVAKQDPNAVMALLPADHLIADTNKYHRVLRDCFDFSAREKVLVAIGIRPKAASSAYGYIERGTENAEGGNQGSKFKVHGIKRKRMGTKIFRARRFLEKPDAETARRLVKSGRFYWNAGMFVWSASAILDAFKRHSALHAKGWMKLQKNGTNYLASGFLRLPKISIDYAVMEKASNICVAEGTFDWDDVGSWPSLQSHFSMDAKGNSVRGEALVVDTHGCLVLGGKRLIATLGVRDLVIVQTEDATLICHRDAAQRIKEIVGRLPKELR